MWGTQVRGRPAHRSTSSITSPQESPIARLSLLNGFELRQRGRAVPLPRTCRRLLAFLALRGRPSLRSYVAGTLWLDVEEERAGASLRSTLWRLRRLELDVIETSNDHLWLAPDVTVDLRDAVKMAWRLMDRDAPCEMSEADERVLSADILPDWYDDWVVIERERYRQLRLHALECLCERLIAAGEHGRAVQAGVAAVAGEPLRESAHRVLIVAHLAEGNRSEAIRQYETYRRLMHQELGLELSPAMEALIKGSAPSP